MFEEVNDVPVSLGACGSPPKDDGCEELASPLFREEEDIVPPVGIAVAVERVATGAVAPPAEPP